MKYESLVKEGQWDTKSRKVVDIHALNSKIKEIKIIFAKKKPIKIETRT